VFSTCYTLLFNLILIGTAVKGDADGRSRSYRHIRRLASTCIHPRLTICAVRTARRVSARISGGVASVSKLYSFVPYHTYISVSKDSRQAAHVFQSPVCSSLWWDAHSVKREWLWQQLFLAYEKRTYFS
jgi:hypothetical protein